MINKRVKNTKATLVISERRELLRKYVNLYQVMNVPEDKWLTSRVKDFFIECLILYYDGTPLHSREAINSLNVYFAFNDKNRNSYIYRGELVKRGWLDYEMDGIKPNPAFLKEFDELKLQLLITN